MMSLGVFDLVQKNVLQRVANEKPILSIFASDLRYTGLFQPVMIVDSKMTIFTLTDAGRAKLLALRILA